ncbi:MAG: response regulator [Calditrichaeota bacterium]|nr:MAG: response regulator [Calditrichota bacterium]MBL1207734.1 response regulator [Calditrichota bacterium]NOG47568.1 response regulator [Calditrichota bacterium]
MKLYQSNCEDNTLAASLGHIILYSFLFLLPDDGLYHPSISIYTVLAIISLTIPKIALIFFNRGKKYEEIIAFILIELSAVFWTITYISEIVLSSQLNHYIIILFLNIVGISFIASFALFKNLSFNYLFNSTLLIVSALFTFLFLEELQLPFILIFLLSFVIGISYSKVHNKNWLEFLAEKDRSIQYSQALAKTNEKLKEALAKAESATRMKGDFIATVSHEIRTPMNGILGMTTLLRDSNLNEEQKEFVDMIQSSADSLLTIIDDILDFSKLESGKLRVENVSFNILEVLNEIAVVFGELSSSKGLDFQLKMEDEFQNNVIGDPVRLRQVLINIIGNAIKFTLQGYIKLSVKMDSIAGNIKMVQFKIEDTGIGIEKQQLDTIFDRFTQADASTTRKFGGTGLGLAITKELVDLMSGELQIDSRPGIGTVFLIKIPFKLDSSLRGNEEKPNNNRNLASLNGIAKGKTILLVEDNLINQKVASLILQKTGCSIETALNGQEAVEMVKSNNYDLIFMDIQMPVLNGVEATAKIRVLQQNDKYTPIIAMTADAMKGDREKYISAGMDDYISKPIKQEVLFSVLSEWISKNNNNT